MPGPGTPLLSEGEIWSALVVGYLDMFPVYVQALCNRNYEGEAKFGGTVHAFWVNEVTIGDYTGPWLDAVWQVPADNKWTLQIEQQKMFAVRIPDVREFFSVLSLMNETAQRAAYGVSMAIDNYVSTKVIPLIDAANTIGTAGTPIRIGFGEDEIYPSAFIAQLQQRLWDAGAAPTTPAVVVPGWMHLQLQLELGTRYTELGDRQIVSAGGITPRAGLVGQVHGVDVYYTQVVPRDTTGAQAYNVIAGDKRITYASAIEKVEVIRLQNDFADGLKGLYVFGAGLPRSRFLSLGKVLEGATTVPPWATGTGRTPGAASGGRKAA